MPNKSRAARSPSLCFTRVQLHSGCDEMDWWITLTLAVLIDKWQNFECHNDDPYAVHTVAEFQDVDLLRMLNQRDVATRGEPSFLTEKTFPTKNISTHVWFKFLALVRLVMRCKIRSFHVLQISKPLFLIQVSKFLFLCSSRNQSTWGCAWSLYMPHVGRWL